MPKQQNVRTNLLYTTAFMAITCGDELLLSVVYHVHPDLDQATLLHLPQLHQQTSAPTYTNCNCRLTDFQI